MLLPPLGVYKVHLRRHLRDRYAGRTRGPCGHRRPPAGVAQIASDADQSKALSTQKRLSELYQQGKKQAESKVATIDAQGKADAMKIMARADADRIDVLSATLGKACESVQQQEVIRASGSALTSASTVLLAQDTGALTTLLSGAQGAKLAPAFK